MKTANELKLELTYLIIKWHDTRDPKWSIEIADLIGSKDVGVKLTPRNDDKILFTRNKFPNSKCNCCLQTIMVGDNIVCQNKKAYHPTKECGGELINDPYVKKCLENLKGEIK